MSSRLSGPSARRDPAVPNRRASQARSHAFTFLEPADGDVASGAAACRVRLLMHLAEAEALEIRLTGRPANPDVIRLLDQLWLRSVLIEQWRRTRLSERAAFARRADRLLSALDPSA